jgi:hypothetical protein
LPQDLDGDRPSKPHIVPTLAGREVSYWTGRWSMTEESTSRFLIAGAVALLTFLRDSVPGPGDIGAAEDIRSAGHD